MDEISDLAWSERIVTRVSCFRHLISIQKISLLLNIIAFIICKQSLRINCTLNMSKINLNLRSEKFPVISMKTFHSFETIETRLKKYV